MMFEESPRALTSTWLQGDIDVVPGELVPVEYTVEMPRDWNRSRMIPGLQFKIFRRMSRREKEVFFEGRIPPGMLPAQIEAGGWPAWFRYRSLRSSDGFDADDIVYQAADDFHRERRKALGYVSVRHRKFHLLDPGEITLAEMMQFETMLWPFALQHPPFVR